MTSRKRRAKCAMTFPTKQRKKRDLQIRFSHEADAIRIDVLGLGWRAPKAKWLSPTRGNERTNERPTTAQNPRRRVQSVLLPLDPLPEHCDHGAPNRRSAHRQDRCDDRQVPVDHPVRYVPAEATESRKGARRANSVIACRRHSCGMENLIRGRRTNSTPEIDPRSGAHPVAACVDGWNPLR